MKTIYDKILIGKLFRFYPKHELFVIVATIKLKGRIRILIAKYDKKWNSCLVYSWYNYSSNLFFEGRDTKQHIRKCIKTHPDKLKYHIGKIIDISKVNIWDNINTKCYTFYLKHKKEY